jgi:hypothetical protein
MKRPSLPLSLALLGFLAASSITVAGSPSWTYVEAGYNNVDLDNLNEEGDGWFVGASLGFKHMHLFGRAIQSETDVTDSDFNRWYVGGGWHGLLGERSDLVGELAYVDAEVGATDDSGYFGRAGVRWRPINLFEAGGFARFEDLDELDDDVVWEANAMLYVWRLSLGLSYETQDDVDTYNVFARFNLGGR